MNFDKCETSELESIGRELAQEFSGKYRDARYELWPPTAIDEEELDYIIENIQTYLPMDAKLNLGRLLIETIRRKSQNSPHRLPAYIDFVIYYLDGYCLDTSLSGDLAKHLTTHNRDQNSSEDMRHKERIFSSYTRGQASAIFKWLLAARKWEEVSICLPQLDSALEYWGDKMEF